MMEPLFPAGTTFPDQPDAEEDDEVWVLDSSLINHHVRSTKLLKNSDPCFDEKYKWGFSGLRSQITCTGDAFLPSQRGGKIKLRDVSCVPESVHNIISVSRLTTNFPFSVVFYPSGFVVKNFHTKKDIAKGQLDSNQYLWPRTEATKPKGGIISMFSSIHKQLMSSFNKEVAAEDDHSDDVRLGFGFQEAWPRQGINLDDVELRDSWIMSSYATQHITNDRELLGNLRPFPEEILFPDFAGRMSPATHVGEAYLVCSGGEGIVLHEVLLVPESLTNYVSVSQLTLEYPCSVEFRSEGFIVKSLDDNRFIADGPKYEGFYRWLNTTKNNVACTRENVKAGERRPTRVFS